MLFSTILPDDDLERLVLPINMSALYDADILLTQPRRYQAAKTSFARRVSLWITDHEVEKILASITSENSTMMAGSAI